MPNELVKIESIIKDGGTLWDALKKHTLRITCVSCGYGMNTPGSPDMGLKYCPEVDGIELAGRDGTCGFIPKEVVDTAEFRTSDRTILFKDGTKWGGYRYQILEVDPKKRLGAGETYAQGFDQTIEQERPTIEGETMPNALEEGEPINREVFDQGAVSTDVPEKKPDEDAIDI